MREQVKSTSLRAYRELYASGVLSKRYAEAHKVLVENEPLTGRELSMIMGMPEQWKLLAPLGHKGLAHIVGERPCEVTGRICQVWTNTTATTVLEKTPLQKLDQKILRKEMELRELKEERRKLLAKREFTETEGQTSLFS